MIFSACRNRFEVHLKPYARNCQLQGGSSVYSSITVKPILVRILFCKPVIPPLQSSYFGFTDLPQSFLLSLDIGPGSLSDMVLSFIVCFVAASGLNIAFHLTISRSRIFTFNFKCGSSVIHHTACTLPISFLHVHADASSLHCSVVSCFYSDIPRSMPASCLLLLTYSSYPPCFHVSMLLQNLLCCSTGQCLLFTFSMDVQPSIFLFTLIYPVINPKKNSIASSHDRFSVAVVTPNAHSDAFLTTRNEIWILKSFWHSSLYISSSPAFSSSPCRVVVFYPTQNPYNLRFYIYEY
ncbi:MAG: hypothetical protein NXY57DRAFT_465709 [Lentinula lateritia]|uniref:Uncharacterized protein n=1 Tax=Lentinula lateritia TaxID=40482 RepID=A0ABQ8UYV2_9AGAR|nr:MAG: hypothetical protein NXY57DRAFT_465709 [Lentinula lateritia]KAJ4466330.1 hypothetical protein C8R41DRAFT_74945 [Lentinula lateritia]